MMSWATGLARATRRRAAPLFHAMVDAWREDRVTGLAAEVAFWSLLSLFPMLVATTAVLGSLEAIAGSEVAENAETQVLEWMQRILTDEADQTIQDVEGLFATSSPGLFTVSLLAAVWAASRGFAAIIRALDIAYDLEETRSYMRTRVVAVAMALGSVLIGAVMLAMLVVGPLLGTGRDIADRYDLGDFFTVLWSWARWPAVFLAMVTWAATILHIAPNHKTPWRWDLPGAILTTFAWGLFSFGLRYYLAFAGGTNQVLSLLGGSLITLIWLFLLAIGLLVGGELNAVLIHLGIAPDPNAGDGDGKGDGVDRF